MRRFIKNIIRKNEEREERAYEQAALEIFRNQISPGLWTKCLADSNMRQEDAKSLYVRRRAKQILHEWDLEAQTSIRENSAEEHDHERRLQEAVRSGLSDDELDYLGRDPITVNEYLNRHHHVVVGHLRKAIRMGEVKAVKKGETLWIKNVDPKKLRTPWYGGF